MANMQQEGSTMQIRRFATQAVAGVLVLLSLSSSPGLVQSAHARVHPQAQASALVHVVRDATARFLELVTQDLDLFAKDVHEDVRRRLRASANVCLYVSAVICLRTSVGVFSLDICGGVVDVCGRRHADKFRLVEEAIRGRAELALVDEFVERATGNAKLARGIGFGEVGHGP